MCPLVLLRAVHSAWTKTRAGFQARLPPIHCVIFATSDSQNPQLFSLQESKKLVNCKVL